MEILYLPPLQRQQQVWPAVAVGIAPHCGGHHAYSPQGRRHRVGDVFKLAPAVGQQRTAWGMRILAGRYSSADKQVQPAVVIEVRRHHRAHAHRESGQGVIWCQSVAPGPVVQIQLRLILPCSRRQGAAAFRDQQVVGSISCRGEQQYRAIIDRAQGHRCRIIRSELPLHRATQNGQRRPGCAPHHHLVTAAFTKICHGQAGPAAVQPHGKQPLQRCFIDRALLRKPGQAGRLADF